MRFGVERTLRYGPVSKTHLLGEPAVLVTSTQVITELLAVRRFSSFDAPRLSAGVLVVHGVLLGLRGWRLALTVALVQHVRCSGLHAAQCGAAHSETAALLLLAMTAAQLAAPHTGVRTQPQLPAPATISFLLPSSPKTPNPMLIRRTATACTLPPLRASSD